MDRTTFTKIPIHWQRSPIYWKFNGRFLSRYALSIRINCSSRGPLPWFSKLTRTVVHRLNTCERGDTRFAWFTDRLISFRIHRAAEPRRTYWSFEIAFIQRYVRNDLRSPQFPSKHPFYIPSVHPQLFCSECRLTNHVNNEASPKLRTPNDLLSYCSLLPR